MTLREKIEVMEAFERGEEIESKPRGLLPQSWKQDMSPLWDWFTTIYRIKPKPKQIVVIEKWLCQRSGDAASMYIWEATKEEFGPSIIQVKLLDTYKVEL